VTHSTEIGPLTIRLDGDTWRITLTTPDEVTLELPPGYDLTIRRALDSTIPDRPVDIVFDLDSRPGISSRQLGLMLALRKAVAFRGDRLRIVGATEPVRELLRVTRTEQFFEFA